MSTSPRNSYTSTDHLRERVAHLASGLSDRLDEVATSEYPNATPRLVVEILQQIIQEAKQLSKSSTDDVLGMICELLMFHGILLDDLDNANTEQTPHALTGILEWLYKKLDRDPVLLASPREDYNYSIYDLRQYLDQTTRNILSEGQRDNIFGSISEINVISFPRIETDNILLHAVFGHEFGHPLADRYLQEEELGQFSADYQDAIKKVNKDIESEYASEISDADKKGSSIPLRSELLGKVLDIRRRGLQELLSDAIGVLLLGPSAIFAAHEIFMTSEMDQPPVPDGDSWYPPNRYRIRLMLKVADELGSWESLKGACPRIRHCLEYIENIVEDTSDQAVLNMDPLIKIAYDWIENSLRAGRNFTQELAEKAAFPTEKIGSEVPRLVERISMGIPPNETGPSTKANPVDWRSAILAGWVVRFEQLGQSQMEHMQLFQLTRKAIDNILLREEFSEAASN